MGGAAVQARHGPYIPNPPAPIRMCGTASAPWTCQAGKPVVNAETSISGGKSEQVLQPPPVISS